jgi:hypothetical protein
MILVALNWTSVFDIIDGIFQYVSADFKEARIIKSNSSYDLKLLEEYLLKEYPTDKIAISFVPVMAMNEDGSQAHFMEIELKNPSFLNNRDPSLFKATANEIASETYNVYSDINSFPGIAIKITKTRCFIIACKKITSGFSFLMDDFSNEESERIRT